MKTKLLTLQQIEKHLTSLTKHQQIVIKGLFFEGKTKEELAKTYGITPTRINSIKVTAIKHIRWWESLRASIGK